MPKYEEFTRVRIVYINCMCFVSVFVCVGLSPEKAGANVPVASARVNP